MSEVTTATFVPPAPAAVGAPAGHRYDWQGGAQGGQADPGTVPVPGGVARPAVVAPADGPLATDRGRVREGVSQACRAGAHAGCPDRVAAAGAQRRCGCGCHRRAERWAYAFYVLAAAGAVIGQVWVAVEHIAWPPGWPVWGRVAVTLPFALCLELLGMATAALADARMRLGERALGLRVFSAAVATTAVTVIVVGHWPDPYLVVGFGALSAAAYLLWMLHAGARRRDALRAAGLLSRVAPAYGWYRWLPLLGRPGWRVTHRARELSLERGLDLHESLRAAAEELRARARRPAIAAAVRAVVRAEHADALMAEIAVRTLDHDRIAAELAARADYAGWANRLAAAVSVGPRQVGGAGSAVSGHQPRAVPDTEPDTDLPDGGSDEPQADPDYESVRQPDPPAGTGRERPDNGRRSSAPRPNNHDGTGHAGAGRNGRVSVAQVVEAMSRVPRPTQVEVARELGVSDRTVRRHLERQDGHAG